MLIDIDAKALEIRSVADLSRDPVLIDELVNKVDIHEHNRIRFRLPTGLLAKKFVFRLIYGGSAYSYKVDPDFVGVSRSEEFWQRVIAEFYTKYVGIQKWHCHLAKTVVETGRITIPTGRTWEFSREFSHFGELKDIRIIKNYPVQGYGADLVMLARIDLRQRMKNAGLKALLVNTVHDSIVVDAPDNEVEIMAKLANEVFADIPKRVKQIWNHELVVPMTCKVQIGKDWLNMEEV